MIKMAATLDNNRKVIVLGITEMNVMKMREGKPIHLHGEELNLPGFEIWITLGFAPLVGPDTRVNDHRSKPKDS